MACCHGASSPSTVAAPRRVVVHLVSDDCPAGFLRVWYSFDSSDGEVRETESDASGDVAFEVGVGSVRANLLACGTTGSFTFDSEGPALLSYRLPVGASSSLPREAWSNKPAMKPARCRLSVSATRERLLTGSVTDLRIDPAQCGLLLHKDGAEWFYTPDRKLVRLGSVVAAAGEKLWIVFEPSEGIVSIDRATGARTVVSKERRRVSLSPHTDVLLMSQLDSTSGNTPLDARWPDGRTRHLSDRARPETTWSSDGRWLVFLDDAKNDGCPTMHVVDAVSTGDRAILRVCQLPGWGLPRFLSDRHLFVSGDAGTFIVDATTGATTNHFSPDAWVTPFAGGVLVQEGKDKPPPNATLWNLTTPTRFAIPFRIDLAHELPTGDLVVFRHRSDHPFTRGVESPFDAVFIDTTTGAARLIAEGVRDSVACSGGVIVLEEDERFIALHMGETKVSTFPSHGGSVESFNSDSSWVGLRGPTMKGMPMWHAIAPISGKKATFTLDRRGSWVLDRAAFAFVAREFEEGAAPQSMSVFVRFLDPDRTTDVAKNVNSYVLLNDGQIVYAVVDDGVYLDTLDSL